MMSAAELARLVMMMARQTVLEQTLEVVSDKRTFEVDCS
jgi:hypothetical protein